MADRSGQQLGSYRLQRLLGRGGFAEVYLAEHIYLGTHAALKVLQITLNDQDIDRFTKEARILASLNHPHIIRVRDFSIEQGTPFLVMEHAPNGTLRHRHPLGSRLPIETIISYVRQAASALQYAHDQHLIHRDVKPENMLLGSSGEVLLSDFGLAMLTPRSPDQSTLEITPSAVVGTTPYLAPEQLQGKPQPASDQYSLGVIVYEWLSGQRPFSGSAIEIALQHISMPPPPLHQQFPGISPAIEEIVMRALAKEPHQRFASMQAFATALERAYEYTLLPRSSFALTAGGASAQNILKPGPIWKVPTIFTPSIGRDKEVADICEMLKQPDIRLLTLLGTGGIGKTRLSIQVAREIQPYFADGICFIHLASVREPDLVIPTIALELGIQEIGTQPILEQVKAALRNKHFLLVLDNFEQVVAAAPLVEDLLAHCPWLKVLVTTREVLHLDAEHEFPVPPLGLPDLGALPEDEAFAQYAAVALFVQRAQAILPTFKLTPTNARAIAEICVRLDGLPLAIELAAARIKLLPPQALLARLPQLFQVVSGRSRTLPLRHQTLRNALQWSYDLLHPEEQRFFRRLSVFAAGWTLEAVEAVTTTLNEAESDILSVLDAITSLLDKSLLIQTVKEGYEPIVQMLLIVREFGSELLRESGEIEKTQRAHAFYYLTFVEEAKPHLKDPEQTTWLARLELAQKNLRIALAWLIEHGEIESALRFCTALWWFWYLRGYWSEGRRWLEATLSLSQIGSPTVTRAQVLRAAGEMAYYQDDYVVAQARLEESVAVCRTLGIKKELANALGALGILMHVQGDLAAARPLLEESETIYRTLGSKWELSYFLRKLGQRVLLKGDLTRAAALAQEALTLAQEVGDKSLIATTFATLAHIAALEDDLSRGVALTRQSLTLARELGNKSLIALALQNLGYYAALQGNLAQAAVPAQEGLKFLRELGDKASIVLALHSLGYISEQQGNIPQAAAYYQEGLSLAQEIGDNRYIGLNLIGLAKVAISEGYLKRAARLFRVAQTILDFRVDMNAVERDDYDRAVESVLLTLGKQAFQAAWAEGGTMTPEQALTAPEQASPPPLVTNISLLPTPTYPDGLTVREVEVLRLLAEGQNVAQIAERLVISPRTVSTHITSIYRKIQVTSRSAATRYAIEHKLV